MAYTHTSLDAATSALALRLSDAAAYVRFTQDELDLAIIEALRTFNSLTGIALDTIAGSVGANMAFIDIPIDLDGARDYTVTDRDLVAQISYALYEKKSTSVWVGSEMFALADITNALQSRLNQFILETGCVVTHNAHYPAAPALITRDDQGEVDLSAEIIDVRRVAWVDAQSGLVTPLWVSSNWALRGFSPVWNLSPGTPRIFAFNKRAPITVQLGPPPDSSGYLDLCTINAGPTLNPATGVVLSIPDDYTPWLKWGALATLLSKDGPARDPARAAYCERLYRIGAAVALNPNIIIDARINNRIVQFSSIAALDQSTQNWQNKTGTPRVIAIAGLNLLAIYPVPNATYGLEITLIRDILVPDQSAANRATSYLQIGKEYINAILGFAQHIAMFKVGGQEFSATTPLAEAFFAAARAYGSRLGATRITSGEGQQDQQGLEQEGSQSSAQQQSQPQQAPQQSQPSAPSNARQTGTTLR